MIVGKTLRRASFRISFSLLEAQLYCSAKGKYKMRGWANIIDVNDKGLKFHIQTSGKF